MNHNCGKSNRENTSITREGLKGTGLGLLIHSLVCPLHSVPALLIATGAVTESIASPLQKAHGSLVNKVSEYVSTIHPYNGDQSPIEYMKETQDIAHSIVDYGSIALAASIPLAFVATSLYNKYRSS